MIELFSTHPKPRDEDELAALGLLANQVASVITMETRVLELSTPVLQIRERLLLLPLLGILDPARLSKLTDKLLAAVRARRARVVVVDITGVPGIDANMAGSLLHAFAACRLLGASVIVTGIQHDGAQSLVDSGVDMSDVVTAGDLQSGIEAGMRQLAETFPSPGMRPYPDPGPGTRQARYSPARRKPVRSSADCTTGAPSRRE